MSRRDQIQMTDDELWAFLDEERTMTCATNGPRGWPHLMPLWFVASDGVILAWTFRKSQKTQNLRRDPRATLQFEAGEVYQELRGAMLECDVELVEDTEAVLEIGMAVGARYAPPDAQGEPSPEMIDALRGQAAKRVGLKFHITRTATFDHRKLGAGVY